MKKKLTMSKNNNLTIEQAWDLFIRKAHVKNLSKYTLKTYKYHFDAFCRFTDKTQQLTTITSDTIDNFILYLKEESNASAITINSYLRTIRSFLYYCMECGHLLHYKITMPKVEKKIKETYTNDELQRLLKKPNKKTCTFTEYKTWVFENYLLGTGNRISSALNVQICDINFDDELIIIRKTKNRKQYIIPLSQTLAAILKEYLEIRGGSDTDYVFCNMYGEQGNRRSYQQLVQEYNIKRNVNKTSCHLFRHTFAKNWILNGGDIVRLQKILAHSDLEMTREYLKMFETDLQLDFEKFNPLDRIVRRQEAIKLH